MIQTYLYSNVLEVQYLDPAIYTTRNPVVYAKPLTVYRGIDNYIQVVVKNQDQKPVNLTGHAMQVDIQNPNTESTVQSFAVTFSNISLGRGTFTIDKSVVNDLDLPVYKLTFRTIDVATNTQNPVYVNDNFGVPLDLRVRPAYYSDSVSSNTDTITIDGGTL